MASQDPPLSVAIQERIISASLNSSMLLNFLMGVYTMVYGGAVYLYMSRTIEKRNRLAVLSTISVLYIFCSIIYLVQWYYLDVAVVINGDTRASILWGQVGNPQWIGILNEVLFACVLVVSDGLLIWRCYHVWQQSIKAITVPLIFFVVEVGLSIATTALKACLGPMPSEVNRTIYNNTLSAQNFISLGTTVTTTFIIVYKIQHSSQLIVPKSKKLYRIALMIIESAAAYSVVLFMNAILQIVPSFDQLHVIIAAYYIEAVLTVVAGMSPTVLVARLALQVPSNTAVAPAPITHISTVHFGSHPANGNVSSRGENSTGGNIIASVVHADDVRDPMEAMELKRTSGEDVAYGENRV